MNILLIDKRVSRYEDIVAAIDPVVAVGVVFDYFEDTFDTVKARMRALGITNTTITGNSVGLIQHNYRAPMFSMLASADVAPVLSVATQDPDLERWTQFRDFIGWCKTEFNTAHFDLMACALYSDPDWKYVIDTLATQTGVEIRASTDDTGSATLGGNWFLESHTGVNLKGVYFTEAIEEYRGILYSGSNYALILMTDGTVYGAGDNTYGALGTNNTTNYSSLTAMVLPIKSGIAQKIKKISCGNYTTIAQTSDGFIYGCGYGQGCIPIGTDIGDKLTLTEVSPYNGDQTSITNIISGAYHTICTANTYTAGFGKGYYGQIGLGNQSDLNFITYISPKIAQSVTCGYYGTIIVTTGGEAYACGTAFNGQLGLGTDSGTYPALTKLTLPAGKTAKLVAGSDSSSIILMTDGTIYSSGYSPSGEAGNGIFYNYTTSFTVQMIIPSNKTVQSIFCGVHMVLLMTDGTVYATGNNTYGQLGLGNNDNKHTPTAMILPVNKLAKDIYCGSNFTMVLMTDGTVYATGYNHKGQLGLGDTTNRNILTIVPLPTGKLAGSFGLMAFDIYTFVVATPKVYGDASFEITTRPTTSSSGAITYTSSDTAVATIDSAGNWITIVSPGTATFIATQAADGSYASSTMTSNALTVNKITPTLALVGVAATVSKYSSDAPFTVTASSASPGAVTYTSSNTAKATVGLNTGLVTLIAAGSATITAAQAATAFYSAPTSVTCVVTVGAAESLAGTIVSTSLANRNFTGASFASTVLTNISLSGATLTGVNFSGAFISGANFTNANIVSATNLPAFSTTQKLQLLRNAYNAAISAIQIATPLSGAEINAAITTPVPDISGATFVVKAPAYDASGVKVVTVTTVDVSNNASLYIPMNSGEAVKVNGVTYTFDGSSVLNSSGAVVTFITVLGKPFRLYAGSIIGLNVADKLNNVKIAGYGLYDVILDLFVFKT